MIFYFYTVTQFPFLNLKNLTCCLFLMMIVPGKSSTDRQFWKRKFFLLYEPFSIFMYLSPFIFESLIVMGLENETSHLTPFSLIQLTKAATKGVPELHISWQKIEECSKPHSYLNVPGFGIKSPSFMLPFPFLTFLLVFAGSENYVPNISVILQFSLQNFCS